MSEQAKIVKLNVGNVDLVQWNYIESIEKSVEQIKNTFQEHLNECIDVQYMMPRIDGESITDYNKRVPKHAHDGDIGMDMVAIGVEYDEDKDRYIYHTGFYSETLRGVGCFLMPRSSNSKTDSYLTNSVGLLDSFTYRGEICWMFKNRTSMETRVCNEVMMQWERLSWWKRLRTDYNKFYNTIKQEMISNALLWAPYQVGDRIGQMVWMKFLPVKMKKVRKLSDTARGEGGFGSTGR